MSRWKEFHGPNAGYVLDLYERYLRDPESVDPESRAAFGRWEPAATGYPRAARTRKLCAASALAEAIRAFGHMEARLDPLGSPPPGDPALDPRTHGLTEDDLRRLPATPVCGPILREGAATALEALGTLREIYCSRTGFDFGHLRNPVEREWLRRAVESRRFRPPKDPIDPVAVLRRLADVEAFEHFLHRIFPGKTRFSIEGLDMLVPIFDEVIGAAAEGGFRNILIGMAHRGRLNVLAHVLHKPYARILREFKDPLQCRYFRDDMAYTGDVKYHLGARRAVRNGQPVNLLVNLAPNPSHLEHVNPVVQGMARAAGTSADRPGPPRFDPSITLPMVVHGDLAFPGQGIVAETLNLARLDGYTTGGTIHVIANNQLGFTTPPRQGLSTRYSSDLAKGFQIPIVHVNADDVEACIEAARLAYAYLHKFRRDFLIDLVGYRRYGHNEGDEPGFTQPILYEKIRNHPSVLRQWADRLRDEGLVGDDEPGRSVKRRTEELQRVLESLEDEEPCEEDEFVSVPGIVSGAVETGIPLSRLRDLHEAVLAVPEGFALHPKVARAIDKRGGDLEDLDRPTIGWAAAETLAFASILEEGIPIRITGEDVERGTFSQRHAVFHDVKTGERFVPLQSIPQARAAFEIHNSPLTENAAIGFEFGYNVQEPSRLQIWEAQYGDFVNAAQVMIDEFVVSARAKWGQSPSLVLFLPHGYEGQGPDHCGGRLERFLQLAAENNLRIANCTTAAQFFHLLRRQAVLLHSNPKPLIVMTPKSLLRHPRVAATPRDLVEGRWQPVLDDAERRSGRDPVRRLIVCSGKIHVDLVTADARDAAKEVAIARLEQIYPFPARDLGDLLGSYPDLEEVVWTQEEPENMGAWDFVRPRLQLLLDGKVPLRYLGRPRWSSPAEGSMAWHVANQKILVERAFDRTARLPEAAMAAAGKTEF
jgi:2-oxoglutarate dehydrogenase E1 component